MTLALGYFKMLAFESIDCAIRTSYGFLSAVSAHYVKQVKQDSSHIVSDIFQKVFSTLFSNKKPVGKII